LGDAFGWSLPKLSKSIEDIQQEQPLYSKLWKYTDDTEMAIAIVDILAQYQRIQQDELAQEFAKRFHADMERGYGAVAYWILFRIHQGMPWKKASTTPYSGEGSKGNGAAMRSAPIGAYFHDNLEQVVEQVRLSAEVTHAHPDGQAGAIAIAIASALAVQWAQGQKRDFSELFSVTLSHTPESETKDRIQQAQSLQHTEPKEAGRILGTGLDILSCDTVPLALWCAFRTLGDFEKGIWLTVDCVEILDADIDTLCAMVGGIVASSLTSSDALPKHWLERCEPIQTVTTTKSKSPH